METKTFVIDSEELKLEQLYPIRDLLDSLPLAAKCWIRIIYRSERLCETIIASTTNRSMYWFPKISTGRDLLNNIYESLSGLADGFDGSGWRIVEFKSIIIKYIQHREFECSDPAAPRNSWAWKVNTALEENLPYTVYAALHTPQKNRGRKTEYKNIQFMSSNFEQLSHYYKTDITCFKQVAETKMVVNYVTGNSYSKRINLLLAPSGYYYVLARNTTAHCVFCPTCLSMKSDRRKHSHELELKTFDRPITFEKHKLAYRKPYVVFADFEALQLPTELSDKKEYIQSIQIPCTACAVLVDHKEVVAVYKNTGKDVVDNFIEMMYEWHRTYILNQYKDNSGADDDWENQIFCCICDEEVEENDRCLHHDHTTGESIGLAHKRCNSKLQFTPVLDIVFHNFAGYDSKHIITYLTDRIKSSFNRIVAKGTEKFLSFELENQKLRLRFIDSLQFLLGGLDRLYKQNPVEARRYLDQYYPNYEDGKLETDFDAFKSWEMLEQPYTQKIKARPDIEVEVDHEKVWPTAREYFEYYCLGDCLITAGIFMNFADKIYNEYKVDIVQLYGIPSVAWNCALKFSKIKLRSYEDLETYQLFRDNIRGGYTNCIVHRAETDNDGYIQYFDINALYSWALSQPLPIGDFQEWDKDDLRYYADKKPDCDKCWFILADWEFPRHCHDKLSDLPPLAEIRDNRLISDLLPKKDYLSHYKTFQQCCKLGGVPTVKRVIVCTEIDFFKRYIENNIRCREKFPKGTTGNDAFKLLNNSLYGKTIENIEKYTSVKIDENEKQLWCSVSEPMDVGRYFIRDKEMKTLAMNKPTYIGFSVLELSKWKMLDEWYNKFQPCGSKLLYMDTDSFIVKTPRPLKINSKELGAFKDELDGKFIDKFVGLCAKSYAYVASKADKEKDRHVVKLKGICNKRKHPTPEELAAGNMLISYEDMAQGVTKRVEQEIIKSVNQTLFTCVSDKMAINEARIDQKRYQCLDKINTLPFGHYSIVDDLKLHPIKRCKTRIVKAGAKNAKLDFKDFGIYM